MSVEQSPVEAPQSINYLEEQHLGSFAVSLGGRELVGLVEEQLMLLVRLENGEKDRLAWP